MLNQMSITVFQFEKKILSSKNKSPSSTPHPNKYYYTLTLLIHEKDK